MTQASIPEGCIDLGLGQPQLSHLPTKILRECAEQLFRLPEADPNAIDFLTYGFEQGAGSFRNQLAAYLHRNGLGYCPRPETLFVTNGASQAIELICSIYGKPGAVVLAEDPTYFLASGIFRDHKMEILGMPSDLNGIDTDKLEQLLKDLQSTGKLPQLLYTIPSFQNPSGSTLSLERREALCRLSLQYGFRIVADEVYQLLHFPEQPPPSSMTQVFQSVCRAVGSDAGVMGVISIGSFSKILAPGLRLGWVEAHESDIARLNSRGYVLSGGGLNPFASALVERALDSRVADQHLCLLRGIYKERCDAMCDSLVAAFGAVELSRNSSQALSAPPADQIWFLRPYGGYFVWIHFPAGFDSARFQEFAFKPPYGIGIRHGALFAPDRAKVNPLIRPCVRLCFAHYEIPEIKEGIDRLALAWAAFAKTGSSE